MSRSQFNKQITPFINQSQTSKKRKLTPKYEKSIPYEIIYLILPQLPVKSLVRFKAISTLCFNYINDPSFAIIHRPLQMPKPALLITCPTKLQSAQKYYVADQNGGPATCCLTVPPRFSRYTTQSINGIVCMDFGIVAAVCNPSTRQAVMLKEICPTNSPEAQLSFFCVNFLGFDPKNKQYKVLNSWKKYNKSQTQCVYRVYTLGGPNEWRKLDEKFLQFEAQRESICINGIIFFRSYAANIVCFNVETESFRVIELPEGASSRVERSCLIQLHGRLAIVNHRIGYDDYHFWVLEDYENQIWVDSYIIFNRSLKKTASGGNYVVGGSINTGEIMIVPECLTSPFYVFYYDLIRLNFRRVRIIGLPEYDSFDLSSNVVSVTHYEENILPLP